MVRDELIDVLHELLDAGERAVADGLISDQRKEALDLIQPGPVGRDEVHMPAGPTGRPGLDLRMAACGVVVECSERPARGMAHQFRIGKTGTPDVGGRDDEAMGGNAHP